MTAERTPQRARRSAGKTARPAAATAYVISHTHWDREWYQPFQSFRKRLVYQLGELIREKVDADGFLIDPWKKPLRYRPSKWYPYTAGAAARIDSDQPPGADSYQIWSVGPDEKDTSGNPGEGGDDIPSWSKR